MIQELLDILATLEKIEEKIAGVTSFFTISVDVYLYKVKASISQLRVKIARLEDVEDVEKAIITSFENELQTIEKQALNDFEKIITHETAGLVIHKDSSLENDASASSLTKLDNFLVNFKKAVPGHNEACIAKLNGFIKNNLNTIDTPSQTTKKAISTRIEQITEAIKKIEQNKDTICFSSHEMGPLLEYLQTNRAKKTGKANSTPPNERVTNNTNDDGNGPKITQKMSSNRTQKLALFAPREEKSELRSSLIQKIAENENLVLQTEDLNDYCKLDPVLLKNQQSFKDLEGKSSTLISSLQPLLITDLKEIELSQLEKAIQNVSELTAQKTALKTSILNRQKLLIPTAQELGLNKELDKKNLEGLIAKNKNELMKTLTVFLNEISELPFSEYNEHPNEPLDQLKKFIQEIREDLRTEDWWKTNYLPCNKNAVDKFFDELLLNHTKSTEKQPAPIVVNKKLIDGFIEQAFVIVVSPYKGSLWESEESVLTKRIVALRGIQERITSYPINQVKQEIAAKHQEVKREVEDKQQKEKQAIADKQQKQLELIAMNNKASSSIDKLEEDLRTQYTEILKTKSALEATIATAHKKLLTQKALFSSAQRAHQEKLLSNPLEKSGKAIKNLEDQKKTLASIKNPDKNAPIVLLVDGSTQITRDQKAAIKELKSLETEINKTVVEANQLYDQLVALYNSDKEALITELETLIPHVKDIFTATYNLDLLIRQLNDIAPDNEYKISATIGQVQEQYLDICDAWIVKNFTVLDERVRQIELLGGFLGQPILKEETRTHLNTIDLRLVKLWTIFQNKKAIEQLKEQYTDICKSWTSEQFNLPNEQILEMDKLGKIFSQTILSVENINHLNTIDPCLVKLWTSFQTKKAMVEAKEQYTNICYRWTLKHIKLPEQQIPEMDKLEKVFSQTILSVEDLKHLNAIDLRLVKLWTISQTWRAKELIQKSEEAVIQLTATPQDKNFYSLEVIQENRLKELNLLITAAKAKLLTDKTSYLDRLTTSCGKLEIPPLNALNPFALSLNRKLEEAKEDRTTANEKIAEVTSCETSKLKALVEQINETLRGTAATIEIWGQELAKAMTIEDRLNKDRSKEYATSLSIINKMEEQFLNISNSYLEKRVKDPEELKDEKIHVKKYLELNSLDAKALDYLNNIDKRLVKLWSIRDEFIQINNDYINEDLDFAKLAFNRKINTMETEFLTLVKDNIDKAIQANQGNRELAAFKTKPLDYLFDKQHFDLDYDKEFLALIHPALNNLRKKIHNEVQSSESAKKCYIKLLLESTEAHLHNNQMEHFSDGERSAFTQFIRNWVLKPLQALYDWLCCGCRQDDSKHRLTFFAAPIEKNLVESGNEFVSDLESAYEIAR